MTAKTIAQRMLDQNAEFDAVVALAEQYRRLTCCPVVDDDYPEVRHHYESALSALIKALKINGRIT